MINYQTDLYDENSHLNPSGARKVTDYLGHYLMEQYDLEDQRDNEAYSEWYNDYIEYTALKNNNLTSRNDIVEYLMLLAGDDIQITMDIRDKDIFKNAWILSLLGNLGTDTSELGDDTDFIIIRNRGKEVVVLDDFRDDGQIQNTRFGDAAIYYYDDVYNEDETGYYGLYIDGAEKLVGNINDDTSIQINVYRDFEMIDSVKFVCDIDLETLKVIATNRE